MGKRKGWVLEEVWVCVILSSPDEKYEFSVPVFLPSCCLLLAPSWLLRPDSFFVCSEGFLVPFLCVLVLKTVQSVGGWGYEI